MARSGTGLPPGMMAYLGPAAMSVLFVNVSGGSFLTAVHRQQAHSRKHSDLVTELLMPMNQRLALVSDALVPRSPGLISAFIWRTVFQLLGRSLVSARQSTFFASFIFPVFFHPIDARVRQLQALPSPSAVRAFPDGLLSTLVEEHFFVRSLEPLCYTLLLNYWVARYGLVRKVAHQLSADATAAADWVLIHDMLVEEDDYEEDTLEKHESHTELRKMYAKCFDRWFLMGMVETLVDNYLIRGIRYPLEMMYTRLCCTPHAAVPSPYLLGSVIHISSTEGVVALYSGFSLLVGAMVPHIFTMFAAFMAGRIAIAVLNPAEVASLLDFRPPELGSGGYSEEKPFGDEEAAKDPDI